MIASAFLITSLTSFAQSTQKYEEVSLEKFRELRKEAAQDSLLEFEIISLTYANPDSAIINDAIAELKKHNCPNTRFTAAFASATQYSANESSPKLLDTTYIYMDGSDGMVTLTALASRLKITWVDESIK